ncbi:hypothetical protein L210DRAFT_210003 [Boletus edulis BED1]|uniref:Uncharacterized protein n=1 Tax=Boletus edulis BED1 TaxID=1328754 RepID=A0AAD4BRQ0_BOLED|nr:hypothetical protein L210DRAFT_210003 [Boletus edulis BED1]
MHILGLECRDLTSVSSYSKYRMAHSQTDPRSVVRIAIALTALKHKARDQSTASYLLDLQSCFPVATKNSGNQDWRTYALELEKQVAVLKAQRDADQERTPFLPYLGPRSSHASNTL